MAICGKREGEATRERLGHRPHFLSPSGGERPEAFPRVDLPEPSGAAARASPFAGPGERRVRPLPNHSPAESAGTGGSRALGGAPTSPARAPPRPEGTLPGRRALTWDPGRAASAVRAQPAALKRAPPPPGAGPQPSPADLSLSSSVSLLHPRARPRRRLGNPSSQERALPSALALRLEATPP